MPFFKKTSPLADDNSAGFRSHERLSDKKTVQTGRNSCVEHICENIGDSPSKRPTYSWTHIEEALN